MLESGRAAGKLGLTCITKPFPLLQDHSLPLQHSEAGILCGDEQGVSLYSTCCHWHLSLRGCNAVLFGAMSVAHNVNALIPPQNSREAAKFALCPCLSHHSHGFASC